MALYGVRPDMAYVSTVPGAGGKLSIGLMPRPTIGAGLADVPLGPTDRGPLEARTAPPVKGDAVAEAIADVAGIRARFEGDGVDDMLPVTDHMLMGVMRSDDVYKKSTTNTMRVQACK